MSNEDSETEEKTPKSNRRKPENEQEAMLDYLHIRPEDIDRFKNKDDDTLPPAFVFLEKYFPEKENTGEKSRYKDASMPVNLTIIKLLPEVYPELDEGDIKLSPFIDSWVRSFDKRVTSVEGKSREEFKEILKALLGGLRSMNRRDDDGAMSLMQRMFTTKGENDE